MSTQPNTTDLDRLEALAKAATPGPWRTGSWTGHCRKSSHAGGKHPGPVGNDPCVYEPIFMEGMQGIAGPETGVVWSSYDGVEMSEADASYIVAANPAAILELIALARRSQPVAATQQAAREQQEPVAYLRAVEPDEIPDWPWPFAFVDGSANEALLDTLEAFPVYRAAPVIAQQSEAGEILPCPFCGGKCDPEGWLGGGGSNGAPEVCGPECEQCGATTNTVEDWNRRSTQPTEAGSERAKWDAYMAETITPASTVPRRDMHTAGYRAVHREGWMARAAQPVEACAPTAEAEQVQWRNILKAVDAAAKFCFGGPDAKGSVPLDAAYIGITTCLTAKDGVQIKLEPLPTSGRESAAPGAKQEHPTPCRNRLIESGAQAVPKSCPRCGLNKYCADTALPQIADIDAAMQKGASNG